MASETHEPEAEHTGCPCAKSGAEQAVCPCGRVVAADAVSDYTATDTSADAPRPEEVAAEPVAADESSR